MATQSQANVEQKLVLRLQEVESGDTKIEQAFNNVEEWIIELGERKAFLHPEFKQWMWYDRLHDEWVFAECGVGEGILLVYKGIKGVKKLPQSAEVDDWCVWIVEETPHGPIQLKELRQKIDSGEIPGDVQLWSTQAAGWFAANSGIGKGILGSSNESTSSFFSGQIPRLFNITLWL